VEYVALSAAVSASYPEEAEAGVAVALADTAALVETLEAYGVEASGVEVSEVIDEAYVVPPAQPAPPPAFPPPAPPTPPPPPLVVDRACSAHPSCAALGFDGDCCRADSGICASCCDACSDVGEPDIVTGAPSPPAFSPQVPGGSGLDSDGNDDIGEDDEASTGSDSTSTTLAVILAIVGVLFLLLLIGVIYYYHRVKTGTLAFKKVGKLANGGSGKYPSVVLREANGSPPQARDPQARAVLAPSCASCASSFDDTGSRLARALPEAIARVSTVAEDTGGRLANRAVTDPEGLEGPDHYALSPEVVDTGSRLASAVADDTGGRLASRAVAVTLSGVGDVPSTDGPSSTDGGPSSDVPSSSRTMSYPVTALVGVKPMPDVEHV